MDLRFYFSLFLRRLPWFVLFAALGTVLGVTFARVLPPVYVAQARLLYESEQIPGDLAESTVRTQATEQLQIIQQRILTRAALIDLANRLQVYAPGPGRPARLVDPDEIVADMRNRISIRVTGGGSRGGQQATIITVSFPAATPQLSAAVTNEIVTSILDENVRMRTTIAGQTLDFFEQEVARLDRELSERSARILEFKNANADALPDSLAFRRSQQAGDQERLLQLERTEAALIERRNRLVALNESGQLPTDPAQLTPEQRQLKALQEELRRLLVVLAPGNPRVRMLEAQIASLEAQIAGQAPSGAPAGPSAFDIQMADLDGQLAFIASEKTRLAARLEELQRTIDATPANAIALDALERDFASVRARYDQAVANRAQAATGETIEAMSRGQRISVIEQAVPPRRPERPNRPMIAGAGVAGGIALGLGLILLLELTNRSIRRPQELTAKLGITPFAAVPYMRTRAEARRRGLIITFAMVLVLAGIPAGIWAIDTYYRPIDLIVDQALRAVGLGEIVERLRSGEF